MQGETPTTNIRLGTRKNHSKHTDRHPHNTTPKENIDQQKQNKIKPNKALMKTIATSKSKLKTQTIIKTKSNHNKKHIKFLLSHSQEQLKKAISNTKQYTTI